MPLYNSLLHKFILPIGDTIFSGSYTKHVKKWMVYDLKSAEELEKIQKERLQNILAYANDNVPFYKNRGFSSLKDFPVLTKDILRNSKTQLISTDYKIDDLTKHHSSGSSGVQSFTYMTKEHQFYIRALQTHWWKWSGYSVGDSLLQFGMSQKRTFIKRLKDFFYKCDYVKAFGLPKEELQDIIKRSKKRGKLFITGYPSVINEFAKVAIESPVLNVSGVVCYGDKLFDGYIKNYKRAFGSNTKIIDTYGCAEGMLMASKKDLDYYYIMSPHVYIEVVNDYGEPVKDGEMGNVLVTCLTNYAMPIIRYKLGDLAIMLPKADYPKKRQLNYPLLKKVIGRDTDVVKTNKGINLSVHSFTGVIEYYDEIKQFKIIQNNLEEITIEYIVQYEDSFDISIIAEIKDTFLKLTQNCLNITFKRVNEIKPTKSGKPQIIEFNL